jgi:hypothetical protein
MRHDDGADGDGGVSGRVVSAGLLYFALVFGAGFVLGALWILVLVPRTGERAAELLELPVMVGITWLAARGLTRRLAVPPATGARLGMGVLAGALLLAAEFALVLPLRGLTLAEYFATRDPVAGAAYYAAVLLLVVMPLMVRGTTQPDRRAAQQR